jgi:hypothetical protein
MTFISAALRKVRRNLPFSSTAFFSRPRFWNTIIQEYTEAATSSPSTASEIGLSELIMLHQLGPGEGAAAVRIKNALNRISSLPF